jgi:hypothetical protein
MKIRCSSLGDLMTSPRTKKEGLLSKTAKTMIKQMVREELFSYKKELDNKQMQKGILCEQKSIDLYNTVNFTSYKKNTERLTNDFITGECDINGDGVIIDIKTSWSLDSFPLLAEDIESKSEFKAYEWQLRGYMWLYNKPTAQLAFCLVNTPVELLNDWDSYEAHNFDRIDPTQRITTLTIERDRSKEDEIAERAKAALEYYNDYKQQILNK